MSRIISIRRDTPTADLRVQLGPIWVHIDRGDEAIIGIDVGPFHSQASVDLSHREEETTP